MQIMIPDIAQGILDTITKYDSAFVVGFVDGWHGENVDIPRKDNPLHEENMAYNTGYKMGVSYAEAWTEDEDDD